MYHLQPTQQLYRIPRRPSKRALQDTWIFWVFYLWRLLLRLCFQSFFGLTSQSLITKRQLIHSNSPRESFRRSAPPFLYEEELADFFTEGLLSTCFDYQGFFRYTLCMHSIIRSRARCTSRVNSEIRYCFDWSEWGLKWGKMHQWAWHSVYRLDFQFQLSKGSDKIC